MADRKLSIQVLFGAVDRLTTPVRQMTKAATGLDKAAAATAKQLVELKRSQAGLESFKKASERFEQTGKSLEELKAKTAALKAEIEKSENAPAKLTRQLAKTEKAAAQLATRFDNQKEGLERLSKELAASGVDVANLQHHEEHLGRKVDDTTKKLEKQQAQIKRRDQLLGFGQKLQAIGARVGIAGAVASAAVTLPSYAAADTARSFQSILVDIGQKADISQKATRAIGDQLLRIGPSIAQLPSDLARGIDLLAGAGLDPRLAAQLIAPIGRAATAYNAEITDLANATFSAVDTLKVPIGDAARALDIMAQAGKAGRFEIQDMATQFPALAGAVASLGQSGVGSLADLAAAAQVVRTQTGDSATAANNLLNLLNKINAKDTFTNFKKFGIDLETELKKAAKNGKSPIEAIVEQTTRATKGDLAKLSYLFGDAQVQAALRPLVASIGLYRKIRADALKATGTVQADFAGRLANDGAAAQRKFNAELERFQIVAGRTLLPALNKLLETVSSYLEAASRWVDANPQLVGALGSFAAAVGPVLVVVGPLVSTIGYLFSSFVRLGGWLRLLAPLFVALAGAIGLPGLAVAAIVGAFAIATYKIVANWNSVYSWFKSHSWFEIGVGVAKGLIYGFLSMAVGPFFASQALNIASKFKTALGIKSPSRVFAGIGGNIMAGLTQGLDQGGGGPVKSLQRQAGRLTGALAASSLAVSPGSALAARPAGGASGGANAGAAGPVTNYYSISVKAEGGADPKELARQVMEEIKRLKEAEARASYRDDA